MWPTERPEERGSALDYRRGGPKRGEKGAARPSERSYAQKDPYSWNSDDVFGWLRSLGLHRESRYLEGEHVDGHALSKMDSPALQCCGFPQDVADEVYQEIKKMFNIQTQEPVVETWTVEKVDRQRRSPRKQPASRRNGNQRASSETRLQDLYSVQQRAHFNDDMAITKKFKKGEYVEMEISTGRFCGSWIPGKVIRSRLTSGISKYDIEVLDHFRWQCDKRMTAITARSVRMPELFRSLDGSDGSTEYKAGFRAGDFVKGGPKAGTFVEGKRGVIRYVGKVSGERGDKYGIELLNSKGGSNGTYKKVRYFTCPSGRAIFCKKPVIKISACPRKRSKSATPAGLVRKQTTRGSSATPAGRQPTATPVATATKPIPNTSLVAKVNKAANALAAKSSFQTTTTNGRYKAKSDRYNTSNSRYGAKESPSKDDSGLEYDIIATLRRRDMNSLERALAAGMEQSPLPRGKWGRFLKKHVPRVWFKSRTWELEDVILDKRDNVPFLMLLGDDGVVQDADITRIEILEEGENRRQESERGSAVSSRKSGTTYISTVSSRATTNEATTTKVLNGEPSPRRQASAASSRRHSRHRRPRLRDESPDSRSPAPPRYGREGERSHPRYDEEVEGQSHTGSSRSRTSGRSRTSSQLARQRNKEIIERLERAKYRKDIEGLVSSIVSAKSEKVDVDLDAYENHLTLLCSLRDAMLPSASARALDHAIAQAKRAGVHDLTRETDELRIRYTKQIRRAIDDGVLQEAEYLITTCKEKHDFDVGPLESALRSAKRLKEEMKKREAEQEEQRRKELFERERAERKRTFELEKEERQQRLERWRTDQNRNEHRRHDSEPPPGYEEQFSRRRDRDEFFKERSEPPHQDRFEDARPFHDPKRGGRNFGRPRGQNQRRGRHSTHASADEAEDPVAKARNRRQHEPRGRSTGDFEYPWREKGTGAPIDIEVVSPRSPTNRSVYSSSSRMRASNEEVQETCICQGQTFNIQNVAKVIKAWYGPETHKWNRRMGTDCTRILGDGYLIGQTLRTSAVDFNDFGPDPAPGIPKVLLIQFKSVDDTLRHDHPESIAPQSNRPSPRRLKSGSSWNSLDRGHTPEQSPTPRGGIQEVHMKQHNPRDIIDVDMENKHFIKAYYGTHRDHQKGLAMDVSDMVQNELTDDGVLPLSQYRNLDQLFLYASNNRSTMPKKLIVHYVPAKARRSGGPPSIPDSTRTSPLERSLRQQQRALQQQESNEEKSHRVPMRQEHGRYHDDTLKAPPDVRGGGGYGNYLVPPKANTRYGSDDESIEDLDFGKSGSTIAASSKPPSTTNPQSLKAWAWGTEDPKDEDRFVAHECDLLEAKDQDGQWRRAEVLRKLDDGAVNVKFQDNDAVALDIQPSCLRDVQDLPEKEAAVIKLRNAINSENPTTIQRAVAAALKFGIDTRTEERVLWGILENNNTNLFRRFNATELAEWIQTTLGPQYGEYARFFECEGLTGHDLLGMNDTKLRQFLEEFVGNEAHRARLSIAIKNQVVASARKG